MAAIPSSSSLVVTTHNHYWHRMGSTSRNSSCGSVGYPGEVIPHPSAAFSESPLSHSRPQCWSPPSTRNRPRPPPARSPVTWLRKPQGSSSLAGGQPGKTNSRPPS
uniref:LOW QUALITY PROTEIN: pancreatic progenitor cell differentiation and proliferation factor-like n=1 Tax=Camelus bactrianus TaxID=9837 RepID=A0A9W3HMK5_CAMBA|nr:LOW QUALITY PROTEIN: pancreatic progenitor cell differentiation and proliferation factor-like [Camelus bactrianus]